MTISRLFWLSGPITFMATLLAMEFIFPPKTLAYLYGENAAYEFLQFLIVAAAFCVALFILIRGDVPRPSWLAAWIGLGALCCLYVAGEEVSWGQHFLNWDTPAYWAALNDQGETNLHNTSSWLDQKPRLLLEIGVIVGGLLIPLARRIKPQVLPRRFDAIYPASILWVTAALAITPKMLDRLANLFDRSLFERVSEVQEFYFYYFILLYMLGFLRAQKQR